MRQFLLIFALLPAPVIAAGSPAITLAEPQRKFLTTYCVSCHGPQKPKGDLRLDDLSLTLDTVPTLDRWQKVLNHVNAGDMPPEDAKQPDRTAKADFLDVLARRVTNARLALTDQHGRITVRRLNRREYRNTLRDLLGIDVDVRDLPADSGAGSFDTVGSSLFLSADQVETYLALGRRALDDAFAHHAWVNQRYSIHSEVEKVANIQVRNAMDYLTKKVAPFDRWAAAVDAAAAKPENAVKVAELRKIAEVIKDPPLFYKHWAEIAGAPPPTDFGFRDQFDVRMDKSNYDETYPYLKQYQALPLVDRGVYLTIFKLRHEESVIAGKDWPPGEYTLRIRVAALDGVGPERHFLEVGHPTVPGAFDILSTHQVTGTLEKPQVIEVPVTITGNGSRKFAIREKRLNSREAEVAAWVLYVKKHKTWLPPSMWIDWMELDGPKPTPSALGPILDATKSIANDRDRAKAIVERFATKAYRGLPPEPAFVAKLVSLYDSRRAAGERFDIAIRTPLAMVLASPGFLYLREPKSTKEPRELSSLELATRLSYFLWSAPPDDELLTAAKAVTLAKPEVLAAQVDRLIASPKADAFVRGFTHQWLGLDRLDFFQFDHRQFPEFDDSLKAAVRREVYETFAHVVRGTGPDASLRRLLKDDHVVVNGLLARFYGIDGVTGDDFHKVRVPTGSPRGSLLGMAAVHAMGGNGRQTSPVERGAWVLRKLLHDPPPPAPPNVPQLTRLEGKLLTTRERLVAHQEQPQCAWCHRKIDPIGFGLENFDAIGRWRTKDSFVKPGVGRKEWTIDPAGALHKGPAFADFFELRDLLAAHSVDFAHGLAESLLEYALGRPHSLADATVLETMVIRAKSKQDSLRELVQALVASPEFRRK